jgi:hypothetical protein
MPATAAESAVDMDVTGDDCNDCSTSVFDEDDQDLLQYIEDAFDDANDRVSAWKDVQNFYTRVDTSGADCRMLESMKMNVKRILAAACQLAHKQT